ncbi:Smr domain-containing protein [Maribacter vaceletii]|uniref:Smr domain-containing protein n=1 Tax=Maribacter vaceletii TaxID=1206816 RepID=A0A495DSW0_9FLAO|nr:Smr/MutS family protein [Maribacter vaceletii]RKR07077.1 Smr domain-containing protein [Maribacter vaceletii]
MRVFNIGDKVETIDDVISGTILSIDGSKITIEDSNGFVLSYFDKELMKVGGDISVTNYEIAKIKSEKEIPKKKKNVVLKTKERNAPKLEVDLHVDKLVRNSGNMSSYEKLNLQLETAKRQLEFAMRKRIQKVVFIHGVGEGVLKEELGYLFRRYENLKYYDADYQKYGMGATEVYIYQNS